MAMPLNLHSVKSSGQRLCVLCKHCGRRSTLEHDVIHAFSGNIAELRQLKLKCRDCDSKHFDAFVVTTPQHVSDFMAGAPIAPFREMQR